MLAIRAMPDGFEIEFTKPVDKKTAEDIASYSIESFIYKYQAVYGSPPVNIEKCPIAGVKVSEDGLKARLIVNNLRRYYIYTITLNAIREKENYFNLVHPTAYYTLNNIPAGQKLSMSEVSTMNSARATASSDVKKRPGDKKSALVKPIKASNAVPAYTEVQPLLLKNTCLSCHNTTKRQVGPAYVDVAKRKYSVDELISLIHSPKPEHWPDYSTPMPPLPQVSKDEARKIALWIRSLAK
jgi:cytochrome c551/c552